MSVRTPGRLARLEIPRIVTPGPQVVGTWGDDELRDSVLAVGLLKPVWTYRGQFIDGERRLRVAKTHGKPYQVLELNSERQVLAVLWAEHPERAIERLGAGTVHSYAKELGVRPTAVALVLSKMREQSKQPTKRERRAEYKGATTHNFQMRFVPSFRAMVQHAAAQESRSVTQFVRDAIWARLAVCLTKSELRAIWSEWKGVDPPGALSDDTARLLANDDLFQSRLRTGATE